METFDMHFVLYIGQDAILKLFTHFRGDKIDRWERAKIARAGGYASRVIERQQSKSGRIVKKRSRSHIYNEKGRWYNKVSKKDRSYI